MERRTKLKSLGELFLTFAKIGLFTFGGGYAMISLIEDTCVTRKKWITQEEMTDMTVVAESTPGPIAINMATYTGWRRAGIPGALAATLGVALPSFLIIFFLSALLKQWLEIPWVARAFTGIRAAVAVLILSAGIRMAKKLPRKPLPLGIMAASLTILLTASLAGFHVSSLLLMAAAGLLSLCLYNLRDRRKEADRK